MSTKPVITFAQSQAAMAAMIEKAMQTPDQPVAIAIVDPAGDLILFRKLDGVQVGSVDIALAKARTAARFRRETKALADAIAGGATGLLSVDNIIALEGGVPISYEGAVLGGIGVSGVQSSQDAEVARAGAAALRP